MATIVPYTQWIAPGVAKTVWEGITGSSDVIHSHNTGGMLSDRVVYVEGTFNSVVITPQTTYSTTATGSYVGLVDPNGNAIAISAAGHEQILENGLFIRPRASGATNGSLNVILIERGSPK